MLATDVNAVLDLRWQHTFMCKARIRATLAHEALRIPLEVLPLRRPQWKVMGEFRPGRPSHGDRAPGRDRGDLGSGTGGVGVALRCLRMR